MLMYEVRIGNYNTRASLEAMFYETSNNYGFNRAKKLARDYCYYRGLKASIWSRKSDAHDYELEAIFEPNIN